MAFPRAGAIRLAALAPGGVDAAGPEVPGPGQPREQPGPLLLQLRHRPLRHRLLLSGSLVTSRLEPQPAPALDPYARVAHPNFGCFTANVSTACQDENVRAA